MISNHTASILAKSEEAKALADQIEKHLADGGKLSVIPGAPDKPLPAPRTTWIDPETVLKRKPSLKHLSISERRRIRSMADGL